MLDSEIYSKVADKIESGWAQGVSARNCYGESIPSWGKDAVSWCLSGAFLAVITNTYDLRRHRIRLFRGLGLPNDNVSLWNDDPNRTQEQVVDLLRKAAVRTRLLEGKRNVGL